MTGFVVHRVPRPERPDAPVAPLLDAHTAVDEAVCTELYGHADFCEESASWNVHLAGSPYLAADIWVALPEGIDPATCRPSDGLGYVEFDRSLQENLDVAEIYVAVRADARGRGIGSALYAVARDAARAEGRTVEHSWSFSPPVGAADPGTVGARSGSGAVDGRLPGVAWAVHRGFALEQTERLSTLRLDDAVLARAAGLRAQAEAAASGYGIETWVGPVPDADVDDLAALGAAMSTDVPSADLELEAEVWDAERVRSGEARQVAKGRRWITAAARERASGRLVAFTQLAWPTANPAGVWQEATLVRSAHRGHRLGLAVKAANLTALREANPDARRVHTWNAAENTHMLAINDALGFEVAGLEAAWQKRG